MTRRTRTHARTGHTPTPARPDSLPEKAERTLILGTDGKDEGKTRETYVYMGGDRVT